MLHELWTYNWWMSLQVSLNKYHGPYNIMTYLQNLWRLCRAVCPNILRFLSSGLREVIYASWRSAAMHFCKGVKPTIPLASAHYWKYGHTAITSLTTCWNICFCIQKPPMKIIILEKSRFLQNNLAWGIDERPHDFFVRTFFYDEHYWYFVDVVLLSYVQAREWPILSFQATHQKSLTMKTMKMTILEKMYKKVLMW